MKRIAYELRISEVLLERVRTISEKTGVTESAFIENAIFEKTMDSEKHKPIQDALRDPKTYPFECRYCPRRFKLAAHRANHEKTHEPDSIIPEPEVGAPLSTERICPDPGHPEQVWHFQTMGSGEHDEPGWLCLPDDPDPNTPPPDLEFKLGVDPALIEMDEPRAPSLELEAFPADDVPTF